MNAHFRPKIAVIGVRGYGQTYFAELSRLPVEIVAVCDTDRAAATALAQQYGIARVDDDYQKCIADAGADAVCIATPHFLHYPMALAALRANQHVFCEKPLTICAAHSNELARVAREMGRILTCHYNQRTRDYAAKLRALVQENRLGEVYHIRAEWLARHTAFMFDAATSWRQSRAKSGGGIFIGRGSHLMDAALYILDFPRVQAISATMATRLAGGEVDDFAAATLRLENGASISVETTYLAHLPAPAERLNWRVLGSRGGAQYRSDGGLEAGYCDFPKANWHELTPREANVPVSILEDFIGAIRENREPLVTGEQAAFVTRLLEAGYRSAECGREIVL